MCERLGIADLWWSQSTGHILTAMLHITRRTSICLAQNSWSFQSQRQRTLRRDLAVKGWIPPGRYIDIFSGVVYEGNREIWLNRDLSTLPVLAKEGSIIPLDGAKMPGNGGGIPETFKIIVVVGASGSFEILEDDDTGSTLKDAVISGFKLDWDQKSAAFSINPLSSENSSLVKERTWEIEFLACEFEKKDVSFSVGGKEADFWFNVNSKTGSATLMLGPVPSDSTVSLSLSVGNPQLAPTNYKTHVYTVLDRAYVDFELKRDIWEIVKADVPLGIKISQLSSMGLDEVLLNSVLEYLVADSRS